MNISERSFRVPDVDWMLRNRDHILEEFKQQLINGKYNIVIGTTFAGAGHWRQAERLHRFFNSLGLENQVTFLATDRTSKKADSITDIILKIYPYLQKNRRVIELLKPFMNSRLGAKIVDYQVESMAKQGEKDIKEILEGSGTFNKSKPTIFISTHSMIAGGFYEILKERNNPDDWVIEFVPDPWKDSDLRAMTIPHVNSDHWIVVVHDEDTVKEYRKVRPDSKALVVSWGTLSNAIYLERRKQLKSKEEKERDSMDVIIEFSGNHLPKYDEKIISFIINNAEAIAQGRIRLLIDPMHHKESYIAILAALEQAGLKESPNVLLLEYKNDIGAAILRREDILEGKFEQVNNYFQGKFNPFAVIAKGGEVSLEDRADMLVFCPYASVPHEEADIKAGVREGRVFDAQELDESKWLEVLEKLFKEKRRLPEPSAAILAPALIYIAENPYILNLYSILEVFRNKRISNEIIQDFYDFSFRDLKLSDRFYEIFQNEEIVSKLLNFYPHESQKRKVNGKPYLRHVLRTAALADSLWHSGLSYLLGEENYERFILTALFHDTLEMNPEEKRQKIEEFLRSKNIFESVNTLTPEKHGDGEKAADYLERKKSHSNKVFKSEDKVAIFTYFCDKLAVLEETVDDYKKDGKNEVEKMKRPLSLRYLVFADVYHRFKDRFEDKFATVQENSQLLRRFRDQLNQLFDLLPENSNLRKLFGILEEGKYKYSISGDSIILAPFEGFFHNLMIPQKDESFRGGIIKVSKGPFTVDFITESSSIGKDYQGQLFFDFLAGNDGRIELKRTNPNSPFAGLTNE